MTFMDDYRADKAVAADIEWHIESWLKTVTYPDADLGGLGRPSVDIHEYLGMTWDQFVHHCITSELPG